MLSTYHVKVIVNLTGISLLTVNYQTTRLHIVKLKLKIWNIRYHVLHWIDGFSTLCNIDSS